MKKEIKICMSPYKIVYSVLFLLLFSLAMGVAVIPEIGPLSRGRQFLRLYFVRRQG